jgi:hypothetical protein
VDCIEGGKHVGWDRPTEQTAMHAAIWHQHIDVDLLSLINTSAPLQRGGRILRSRLAAHWLGIEP